MGGGAIFRIDLGLGRAALLLPAALCLGGAALLVQMSRRHWSAPGSPVAIFITLVAVYATVALVGFPVLERSRPAATLGRWVAAHTPTDMPIGVYRLEWGSSIRYYADRRVVALADADGARAFLEEWPDAYVFLRRDDQHVLTDARHELYEVIAADAIVGRTGRYIRQQVWGAVTVTGRRRLGAHRFQSMPHRDWRGPLAAQGPG